jgi:hypothetical protein
VSYLMTGDIWPCFSPILPSIAGRFDLIIQLKFNWIYEYYSDSTCLARNLIIQ